MQRPIKTQTNTLRYLINKAKYTEFGKDHSFGNITSYHDFKNKVPIRDYEMLKPYIEKVRQGKSDVLWPGKPLYFAKTSGTTSGIKYIPLTKRGLREQIKAAKNSILFYIARGGDVSIIKGKMIYLQGNPTLKEKNGIKIGRLSGIVAHYVPKYLQKKRLPSWEVNCTEDWEVKLDGIIKETEGEDMTLISGIPSWVQMYFEKLVKLKGKNIGEVFPNFNLLIYGGVNYEPYAQKFKTLIGRSFDSIELFPASEGFFAFQDLPQHGGMLLLLNSEIFYEFVPVNDIDDTYSKRISIEDVKLGVNYLLIVSTSSGLWAYNVGDTVEFVSLKPYRVIVTGRLKHFISAFGEHVISKEVEQAIGNISKEHDLKINEFTVAPQFTPEDGGKPYHEWFIEFDETPQTNLIQIANLLDVEMQSQNIYYKDLIEGKILRGLKIITVRRNGFSDYMRQIGKLGGQHKIQRLSNDRVFVDNTCFKKILK